LTSPDRSIDVFKGFGIERQRRDGSLTLYMQHKAPEGGKREWIPAPAGTFFMAGRFCGPEALLIGGPDKTPESKRVP